MRDVEDRLPIFRTAFGCCASGRLFDRCADDIDFSEDECGVEAGARDCRVLCKQSFRAIESAVDHGVGELIGGCV
jgi:hypothetical protein